LQLAAAKIEEQGIVLDLILSAPRPIFERDNADLSHADGKQDSMPSDDAVMRHPQPGG